ncbi:MAG: carbohydrate ABC transporter permease [Microcystaceae cyanobacterium]
MKFLFSQRIRPFLLWIAVIITALFCLLPILWQILTSLKVNGDISAIPTVYFPRRFTLEHYYEIFTRRPFFLYLFNSALVAVISTFLCLVIGSPAAYALARLKLVGENLILLFILGVTLFPYVLLFLGLLEVIKFLGLGNNYIALVIPYTAMNLPLTILVMRSFFQKLPTEIEDAAKIDGYSITGMLIHILLPMTLPALVTTSILTFIFAWNEYIFALTFIPRDILKTVPVATAQIGGSFIYDIPYGAIAAATIVGTFPLVILVLVFQRKIVEGLTAGAVKG